MVELDKKDRPLEVPYIVHESTVDRLERAAKRLWILCIVIFIAFVASNAFWIWYDKQYSDIVTTQEVSQEATADGNSNIHMGNCNGGNGKTDD